GATPVFIDSELRSWNMAPGLLEEELDRRAKVGKLPKAVLVVDLYGQCADYEAIVAACRKYDVPLVEDAVEALGGTYQGRPAGVFGDLAIFSFNGNKIIRTSWGRGAGLRPQGVGREGALSGDPGSGPGAALPALARRLQLPPEQPPRGRRKGPAPRAR